MTANPLLYAEVIKLAMQHHDAYVAALDRKRSCEASNAILDLMGAVVDPKAFAKFSSERQKSLMRRAIEYQFQNGNACGAAPCEKEFFEKFSEKRQ